MDANKKPLLEITDLRTRFHTPEGTVYAVNSVSFKVDEGETLAVVGESGCGKTVTMLSFMRLLAIPPAEIASGQAIYRDQDLLQLNETEMEGLRGKEIGMIFQDPMTSLNPVLSIQRQMTESLRVHFNMDRKAASDRALEMLESVGIPDPIQRLKDYPHQFSGGMRQRVMIAMALACAPSLLIADEPTTALDVTIQAQIIELVKHLREHLAMAMIWITHDLGIVAGLAERVIVMYAGFIVEEALVDELYENPNHPYTIALLNALPRIDQIRHAHLNSIPGAPPNLLVKPHGCPFALRCSYVIERCRQEMPPLNEIAPGHKVACWYDVHAGSPR
jgi:oligopeptide/dipeptide ABC transporter ATP-binding protein